MTHERYAAIDAAAVRLWKLTRELDRLRGDLVVTFWVAAKCHAMIRDGTANDPEQVTELADALERRLSQERAA